MILDGRLVADKFLSELKSIQFVRGRPGLAVIRIGSDPASQIYVRKKIEMCRQIGFHSAEYVYEETVTEAEILQKIVDLNRDAAIHGILVQLPLPKHLSTDKILEMIDPRKDVDGFHPINVGYLTLGKPKRVPCTPLGIINLLDHYQIQIEGQNAVVLGRSRVVGRPVSLLLDQRGATVTVIHMKTRDRTKFLAEADIIVSAVGKPGFIKNEDLKPSAVMIDVGTNRLPSGSVVGDIDFENVSKRVHAISKVPGGVGPMTIAMLMKNTYEAFLDLTGAI